MITLTLSPKVSGVYLIRNKVNGKLYVGSASDIRRRWRRHVNDLKTAMHTNQKLSRAWLKYGQEAFEFSVIQVVEPSRAAILAAEQIWIDALGCCGEQGYNILPTAGSSLGVKRSADVAEAIRRRQTGLKHSDEAKARMREAKIGGKLPAEHVRQISLGNKGKKMSRECIEKRIATAAKRPGKSGAVGVDWHKSSKKWRVRVKRGGREQTVGMYESFTVAVAARAEFLARMVAA